MIIVYIIRLYIYVSNLICPHVVCESNDDIKTHTEYYTDDIINKIDNDVVIDDNNNINDTICLYAKNINRYPFNKSRSYTIPTYYCGFCSESITRPQHMYSDRVYCSISCRNHQIKLDESTQTRERHSFTV